MAHGMFFERFIYFLFCASRKCFKDIGIEYGNHLSHNF